VETNQGPPSRWHAPSLPWSYGLRPRRKSTPRGLNPPPALHFTSYSGPFFILSQPSAALPLLSLSKRTPFRPHMISLGTFSTISSGTSYHKVGASPAKMISFYPPCLHFVTFCPLLPCVVSLFSITVPVRSLHPRRVFELSCVLSLSCICLVHSLPVCILFRRLLSVLTPRVPTLAPRTTQTLPRHSPFSGKLTPPSRARSSLLPLLGHAPAHSPFSGTTLPLLGHFHSPLLHRRTLHLPRHLSLGIYILRLPSS
jgi:hypothetical protein